MKNKYARTSQGNLKTNKGALNTKKASAIYFHYGKVMSTLLFVCIVAVIPWTSTVTYASLDTASTTGSTSQWNYDLAATAPIAEDTGLGKLVPDSKVTGNEPEAPTAIKNDSKPSPSEFKAYFILEAKKRGVWVDKAVHMAEVESAGWDAHARGDQKITEKDGIKLGMCTNKKSPLYLKPANARGGAQITECWFPQISDAQADDYIFATSFMLDQIVASKENCKAIYTTCRSWYN